MNEPMEWYFQNKNERGESVDIRWDLFTDYMRRESNPNAKDQTAGGLPDREAQKPTSRPLVLNRTCWAVFMVGKLSGETRG
jgi:hypothetical protein